MLARCCYIACIVFLQASRARRSPTHALSRFKSTQVHLNGTDMCCRTPAETTHPASSTAKAVLTAQRATATRLIGEGEPPIAPIQSRRWIQLPSSAAHRQAARLRVLHWRWQPGTGPVPLVSLSHRLSGTVIVRGWQGLALTECGTVPTAGPAAFGLSLRLRLGVRVRAGPAACQWHATRDGPRASAPPATVCPPGLHQA
jgi:hypothetical protein